MESAAFQFAGTVNVKYMLAHHWTFFSVSLTENESHRYSSVVILTVSEYGV